MPGKEDKMPQFIGRPNINYGAFKREELPSTGQSIFDTLGKILAQYSETQMDRSKENRAEARKSRETATEQSNKKDLLAQNDAADTVRQLIRGYSLEPASTGMPPAMLPGAQPDIREMLQQVMSGRGQGFMTRQPSMEAPMLPPPAGGMRLSDVLGEAGSRGVPSAKKMNVVPPKEKAATSLQNQLRELDILLKKSKLKGGGKGSNSELLRARSQISGQLKDPLLDEADRAELEIRRDQIDESLSATGLSGFDDQTANDIRDAKKAIDLKKITPEEAQKRLSKKYPGMKEIFRKEDKGWLKKAMDLIGGGE